jgi:hypothetical protein
VLARGSASAIRNGWSDSNAKLNAGRANNPNTAHIYGVEDGALVRELI